MIHDLEKARDEAALAHYEWRKSKEKRSLHIDPKFGDFCYGWDACLAFLQGQAEFDEKAAYEAACEGAMGDIINRFKAGARWQFEQMSARVAADRTQKIFWHDRAFQLEERVKELEAELAKANAYIDWEDHA